jgi:DNA protecting protein DprA
MAVHSTAQTAVTRQSKKCRGASGSARKKGGNPHGGRMPEQPLFNFTEAQSSELAGPIPFPVALLALGSVPGLGQKSLKLLVGEFREDLGRLLTMPHDGVNRTLSDLRVTAVKRLSAAICSDTAKLVEGAERTLQQLSDRKVQIVSPSRIPQRLRELQPDPPRWLIVQGDVGWLDYRPAVAVVGTRKPTKEGLRATSIISQLLAPYPILLISGLAEGIDEEAHRTSLGEGVRNLAFLGHGINLVFPQQTAELRHMIIRSGGAAVSEYLPGEHFQKRYFVERNRLQAGLADLVIPVEATPTGGTAHTIHFARQYCRPVVGIRWPGASGVVGELEKRGDRIIDIMTPAGCRQLDGIFRELAEKENRETYPLQRIEQRLLGEIRSRSVRREDIQRLMDTLGNLVKEPPSNGTT